MIFGCGQKRDNIRVIETSKRSRFPLKPRSFAGNIQRKLACRNFCICALTQLFDGDASIRAWFNGLVDGALCAARHDADQAVSGKRAEFHRFECTSRTRFP